MIYRASERGGNRGGEYFRLLSPRVIGYDLTSVTDILPDRWPEHAFSVELRASAVEDVVGKIKNKKRLEQLRIVYFERASVVE